MIETLQHHLTIPYKMLYGHTIPYFFLNMNMDMWIIMTKAKHKSAFFQHKYAK